jgi:ribose 5-phosphate isomerase A
VSRAKEAAGRRAADLAKDGMTLGLGTGSTVRFALERLAERIREEGLSIRGVPTSEDTHARALELGIPLVGLDEVGELDLAIDGADEIDGDFHMIKGGGGALLREKVVASLSERVVIVADSGKLVERLGLGFLLPVEVVPFARSPVARRIEKGGATTSVRMAEAGRIYLTDNGNEILDCGFPGGIAAPAELEAELNQIPGVVENGLFVGLAQLLVIGEQDGSTSLRERPAG